MSDECNVEAAARAWFERFAAELQPDDQLPVPVAAYDVSSTELRGQTLAWTMQYLSSKDCPLEVRGALCRAVLREVPAAIAAAPADLLTDDNNYSALKLMQRVMEGVNEICLRYRDNAQLDSLALRGRGSSRLRHRAASWAIKNSRRYMEDRHVIIPCLEELYEDPPEDSSECTGVYCVYDGHGGPAAAAYCAALLHTYLHDDPHFRTDLPRALSNAFILTNKYFILKNKQESGSTALVVVIRGTRLLAGWVGDSQAVLLRQGQYMPLVTPHTARREDEQQRIRSSQGKVSLCFGTWRVNGILAVTRSIGDAKQDKWVISEPELAEVRLQGDEDLLVLASDGLWDNLNDKQVMRHVYTHLATLPQEECDVQKVAESLVSEARRGPSKDNITVIVLLLRDTPLIFNDHFAAIMEEQLQHCKRELEPNQDYHNPRLEAILTRLSHSEEEEEEEGEEADLGPETAVDADEPDEPDHLTLTERASEECGVEENVGESGDDSEDEWNYYEGGQKQEGTSASPRPAPTSPTYTPAQPDRGAWEESSESEMNTSPLNPEAPVFVPTTADSPLLDDRLLAESPRKPLPIHDDLDSAAFASEAHARPTSPASPTAPAQPDYLNGHHEKLVGVELDNKLALDMERVQRDVVQLCHLQVGFCESESDPLDSGVDSELVERLKSKERDPMSMSFYQDEPPPELDTVQPLPDSDDDSAETHKLLLDQAPENSLQKLHMQQDHYPIQLDRDQQHESDKENTILLAEHVETPTLIDDIETEKQIFQSEFLELKTEQLIPEMEFIGSLPEHNLSQTEHVHYHQEVEPEQHPQESKPEHHPQESEHHPQESELKYHQQETESDHNVDETKPEHHLQETDSVDALQNSETIHHPQETDLEHFIQEMGLGNNQQQTESGHNLQEKDSETRLEETESALHLQETEPHLLESSKDLMHNGNLDEEPALSNIPVEESNLDDVAKCEAVEPAWSLVPAADTPELVQLSPSPLPPLHEDLHDTQSTQIELASPLRQEPVSETLEHTEEPVPQNELIALNAHTQDAPQQLITDIDQHISTTSESVLSKDNLAQEQIESNQQLLDIHTVPPSKEAPSTQAEVMESRAQEICVSVSQEIPVSHTPPPTPAAQQPAHMLDTVLVDSLIVSTELDTQASTELDTRASTELDTQARTELDTQARTELDTPSSTEIDTQASTGTAVAVAVATVGAATAAVTSVVKKTPASAKKPAATSKTTPGKPSSTTPAKTTTKPASKPPTPATSAARKPAATPAPRTPVATKVTPRTSTSKPTTPKPTTKSATPSTKPAVPPVKTTSSTKPAPATTKTTTRAPAAKLPPAPAKPAPAAAKPTSLRVPAARSVAPPRPRQATARPAPDKPADKPLTNGDVKPAPIKRPTSATAAAPRLAPVPAPARPGATRTAAPRAPPARPATAPRLGSTTTTNKLLPRAADKSKKPPAPSAPRPVARSPHKAVTKSAVNGAGEGAGEGEAARLPDVVA